MNLIIVLSHLEVLTRLLRSPVMKISFKQEGLLWKRLEKNVLPQKKQHKD
ncbi:conserved hypothetical protein [Carnobacterium maltaromaticum]|nr:conserved hypothetical protein [Carnobacterium maltaromaticum]CAD5901444.1 conserved hypothetical protein [Carnobacterium maltaromaticum]